MTLQKFLELWAPQTPPERGAVGAPNLFYSFLFYRRQRRRQMGAGGATFPKGKGNHAEGGYFASYNIDT